VQPIVGNLAELKRLVTLELTQYDPIHLNVLRHSCRVAAICRTFAEYVQLDTVTCLKLEIAALLHDYGTKNVIGSDIINFKGDLTEYHRDQIERHPRVGSELAYALWGDNDIADWILHHHCIKGVDLRSSTMYRAGYPLPECYELLKMPVPLQILICADQFDSAYSGRCGKSPKLVKAIAAEIFHLGSRGAIGVDVANNFRLFLEKGYHEPFYQP